MTLTLTAIPFKSDEAEAAVGDVFATVLVLVSVIWILDMGIPKQRAATCRTKSKLQIREVSVLGISKVITTKRNAQ